MKIEVIEVHDEASDLLGKTVRDLPYGTYYQTKGLAKCVRVNAGAICFSPSNVAWVYEESVDHAHFDAFPNAILGMAESLVLTIK